MHEIFASLLDGCDSDLVDFFLLPDLVGVVLGGFMQFFLIPIKDPVHTLLELHQEYLLHPVSNLIEEAPNILMLVVVIEQPPEPLINPHNIIMQIIKPPAMIIKELLIQLPNKGLILLQVIQ